MSVLLLLGASCTAGSRHAAGPTTPPGSPPAVVIHSELEAKLRAIEAAGDFFYCDPDHFPVGTGEPPLTVARRGLRDASARAGSLLRNIERIAVIEPPIDDGEALRLWDLVKRVSALSLTPDATGWSFVVFRSDPGGSFMYVDGHVGRDGVVSLQPPHPASTDFGNPDPHQAPNCPICLARGTLISTPNGPVVVERLRLGQLVFSIDSRGERIVARVLRLGHIAVSAGHVVVRIRLADGRVVTASPGHPTADGRTVAALSPGDRLAGSTVVAASRIRYAGGATWDLLPSGPTGAYFANGVLLGSTLAPPSR